MFRFLGLRRRPDLKKLFSVSSASTDIAMADRHEREAFKAEMQKQGWFYDVAADRFEDNRGRHQYWPEEQERYEQFRFLLREFRHKPTGG